MGILQSHIQYKYELKYLNEIYRTRTTGTLKLVIIIFIGIELQLFDTQQPKQP